MAIDSHIDFLVSTGAKTTTLMPKDARRLGPALPELQYQCIEHLPGLQIEAAPLLARVAFLPPFATHTTGRSSLTSPNRTTASQLSPPSWAPTH